MSLPARSRRLTFVSCLVAAGLVLAATSSSAPAADSLYWANFGEPGGAGIFSVNLTGGGARQLDTTGGVVEQANGIAIDAAAGKIYWVSSKESKVFSANLSGGGGAQLNIAGATPTGFFVGMTIDPAAGRVYWANSEKDKISYANLNGSGGGDLDTTGATIERPLGVAIDTAGGRIYWANGSGSKSISYASLAGGAGGDLNTTGATAEGEAGGPAIDAATNTIYWGAYEKNTISYASLTGSGGGDLNTAGATVEGPFGTAIDPTTGRIYWINEISGTIAYASLSGGGGGVIETAGATLLDPAFPVLLKAPSPATAPEATGGSKPGSKLSCAPGSWAPDLLGSFLYRVPQSTSIQWLKNGAAAPGATSASLKAASVGAYSCQAIATNQAGSTAQTSIPVTIFSVGKAKANVKKGTATVAVKVPGAGTLTLAGKQLVKERVTRPTASPGTVKLLVKSKGAARKTLGKKGKVKVKATVSFLPKGGPLGSQVSTLVLKKKLAG